MRWGIHHEESVHVYDEAELKYWMNWVVPGVVFLGENQWLCDYSCRFDYAGDCGVAGAQQPGKFGYLTAEGSGEYDHWIIEKTNDNIYIMRGLPKLVTLSYIKSIDYAENE